MEFRQLKYLLEIVKCGSFTKASETLRIAQSALSITVKNLEDETGITIIDRNYRKLTLTAEGKFFLTRAKNIVGQVNALSHEVEELKGLVRGTLKIGIPGMLASHYFPAVISAFIERYPHLKVSIYSDGSKKLETMLCSGFLDAAILGENGLPPELTWKLLLNDEMVACVSSSHHLAGRKEITFPELAKEPLFLFQEGNYQREMMTKTFNELGLQPNVVFETNLTSLLKSMTVQQKGVCTLLRMAIDTPNLIPISFRPSIEINTGIAWRTKSYVPLATRAFIDFLHHEGYASTTRP